MQINLSPVRSDVGLIISRTGDALTINGEAYDFSSLPDGATIPAGDVPCEWIAGQVDRLGGSIHLTLMLPHGPNPPQSVAFPVPIVEPPDGPIALPTDEWTDNVDA